MAGGVSVTADQIALRTRAEAALSDILEIVVALVRGSPEGLRNSDVAQMLGLETDVNGGQRIHFTHAVLNKLVRDGHLKREQRGRFIYYLPAEPI